MEPAPPWGNVSVRGGRNDTAGPAGAGWAAAAALASQALALLLILALSALGNGAVLLAIARHRQLRTVTNAFVLSLSLAELLGALLCLPAALLGLLGRPRGAGPLGQRLCVASAALHAGLGIAATLTMALLSFDRYCAIARRPRRKMGRRRAARLLAAVWLAALALAGPWYGLAGEGRHEAGAHRRACVLPWGPSRLGPPYGAALIVLCYLLPFALMGFCLHGICRAVRLAESRVRPLATCRRLARACGEVRTATTVLIMIVSIICCWGPYCVLGLAAAAGRLPFSPTADAVASGMAWANGAINPLIYAARNPQLSALLRRSREGGYRTRGDAAGRPERRGRAERVRERGLHGPGGAEAAPWACRNPAVLFCRDAPPGTADTSL
ncbi:G-protein coupled receptor 135 [Eudromia elegans]